MRLAKDDFEYVLGYHAAPMLLGFKTANLITFRKSRFADFDGMLESYTPCFNCKGISVFRVSEKNGLVVIMFYRVDAMERDLNRKEAREILRRCGYPMNGSIFEMLEHLRERVESEKTFPHEIGHFLGYPPGDVEGFIRHKGKDYCCCGYWKVYENESDARRLFGIYDSCSRHFCRELDCGKEFAELVRAV